MSDTFAWETAASSRSPRGTSGLLSSKMMWSGFTTPASRSRMIHAALSRRCGQYEQTTAVMRGGLSTSEVGVVRVALRVEFRVVDRDRRGFAFGEQRVRQVSRGEFSSDGAVLVEDVGGEDVVALRVERE